jgi:hypothetical protein
MKSVLAGKPKIVDVFGKTSIGMSGKFNFNYHKEWSLSILLKSAVKKCFFYYLLGIIKMLDSFPGDLLGVLCYIKRLPCVTTSYS